MQEINLGSGNNLITTTSKLVTTHNTLQLITPIDGIIEIAVKIEADFDSIPEKYHEVFFNMICAKYVDKVSFSDNPFSQCISTPRKRWFQFWK
jgi:hypothetical protein